MLRVCSYSLYYLLLILIIYVSVLLSLSRLSLDLFTYSALAEWAQGNTERMLMSIDEVFNNAKSFEDKLRAAEIKLDYQGMTGVKTTGVNRDALGFDGKSTFFQYYYYYSD